MHVVIVNTLSSNVVLGGSGRTLISYCLAADAVSTELCSICINHSFHLMYFHPSISLCWCLQRRDP